MNLGINTDNHKILLLVFLIILAWTGLRIVKLKFFKIVASSMENTLTIGRTATIWTGLFSPNHFEIITYRFPEGDTILIPNMSISYYYYLRVYGKESIDKDYTAQYVPLNKRDIWIGRCVGLPEDKIQLINSELYINDSVYVNPNLKKRYFFEAKDDVEVNHDLFVSYGVHSDDIYIYNNNIALTLTKDQAERLNNLPFTKQLSMECDSTKYDINIFPFSEKFSYNKDNFGPISIPKKGKKIKITCENLCIYKRLISIYEQNKLEIVGNDIIINGIKTNSYTPKMNYYFIICDNRDSCIDSRHWGFLPENHIYGKMINLF